MHGLLLVRILSALTRISQLTILLGLSVDRDSIAHVSKKTSLKGEVILNMHHIY